MKNKIKKYAKYTTNILGMVGTIILGLNKIDGITIPYAKQITEIIILFQGVIGSYLIGGKLWGDNK